MDKSIAKRNQTQAAQVNNQPQDRGPNTLPRKLPQIGS